MKYKIFNIIFFLLPFIAIGQSLEHQDLAKTNYNGLQSVDGKLFYTIQTGESTKDMPYNYVIHTFDSEMNRVSNDRAPVKWGGSLVETIPHNGGFLAYFRSGKEGSLYSYDSKGKQLWGKSFTLNKGNLHDIKMASLGSNGFVIARPEKEKKSGLRVTFYDNEMTEKWSYTDFADKGQIKPIEIQTEGDRIAILAEYKKGAFSNIYEHSLYMFSSGNSEPTFKQGLASFDSKEFVKNFKLNKDGSTIFIGYNYDPKQKETKVAEAIFYKSYDASGKMLFETKESLYENLGEALTSNRVRKNFNFKTPPMVNFHEIIKTPTGYRILGEIFKYVLRPVQTDSKTMTTEKPGTLYILDYVVFDLTEKGEIKEIRRITKPYKVIEINGFSVTSEMDIDEAFEKYYFFAYRYMTSDTKDPQVVSINWSQSLPYIGYTSMNVTHENILNRQFIDIKIANRSNGEITYSAFKKPDISGSSFIDNINIVPFYQKGKMLYAEFNYGKLFMKVMDFIPENPVPENGELSITGIPSGDFRGLSPVGNNGFYTFYFSETTDNEEKIFVYQKLDNKLNITGKDLLVVPPTAFYIGDVVSGDGQVLVFGDSRKRAWYFYAMDNKGVLTGKNQIELDTSLKISTSGNMILQPAHDGFYMIQPFYNYENKENGFEIIRLNSKRQVRWTYPLYVEANERLQLISIDLNHGALSLLHNKRDLSGGRKAPVTNHVVTIEDVSGEELYSYQLEEDESVGFPESIRVSDDKGVTVYGMYFKGRFTDKKNTEGMFLLNLNGKGEKQFFNIFPWKEAEDIIKHAGESNFLSSGKTQILIQDIIQMPDGSFSVIGELFKRSTATTALGFLAGEDLKDKAFSIYDFVVFNFDNNGKLTNSYRIPKKEQNIELSGSIASQKGVSLSLLMRRYNMFSYIKTVQIDGKPYVIYTNTIDNKKLIYRAPLEKSATDKFPEAPAEYIFPKEEQALSKFEMMSNKMLDFGAKLDKSLTGTDQKFTTFRDPSYGYAVSSPENVLVYFYDREIKTLYIRVIKY